MESKICVVHISRGRCKGGNFRTDRNDVDIANVVVSRISVCRLTQRSVDLVLRQPYRCRLAGLRDQAQLKEPGIEHATVSGNRRKSLASRTPQLHRHLLTLRRYDMVRGG